MKGIFLRKAKTSVNPVNLLIFFNKMFAKNNNMTDQVARI